MKIRELIEKNDNIGDLVITLREKDGKLIKSYHIGANVGIEPIRRSPTRENDDYIEVSINSCDTKDIYQLKINKIPKRLLELEVFSWRSTKAFRRDFYHDMERVDIEVWGSSVFDVPKGCVESDDKQLAGQMQIEDFPEVMP